ncbi:aminotransferase class IV [Pleionea sediminis]|uniref:aminotransferase class IV n=1 Tax=Pleionea sediminis TaxID=2569479 RepID=UPI001FEB272E|nr:aminotransferase class IV [Pleionea sediminis]
MTTTVYLNGDWLPLEQASISVMDRGFLFGDGVYEVIPVYAAEPFRMSQHLERLKRSLREIRINDFSPQGGWESLISELVARNRLRHCNVYLQVTRGVDRERDHRFPGKQTPTLFARVMPLPDESCQPSAEGIRVITYPDIRWKRCDIKATTLLANCLARQAAEEAGADEAIFIHDGYAIEGSASNVFIVSDGKLLTAPKSDKILGGVTRDLVLEIAEKYGIPCGEEVFTLGKMLLAEEVWVTSSTREIQPVKQVDDKVIGKGSTGPVWHRMIELYTQYKQRLLQGELK